mmetsp:Transcript_12761/g.23340  ORF Transcript_12761/g.23340 Transcript_12761/m.23340 type:complete len:147 (-) Transcript_12761:14-454(-)
MSSLSTFAPVSDVFSDDDVMDGGALGALVARAAGRNEEPGLSLTAEERERLLEIRLSALADREAATGNDLAGADPEDSSDTGGRRRVEDVEWVPGGWTDVKWHHCDQDGCSFKSKQASKLKQHKLNIHNIKFDSDETKKKNIKAEI